MDEKDFATERDLSNSSEGAPEQREGDGTLVLEKLARIDGIDDFFAAIDSDDIQKATELMKAAGIDAETITVVLKKMADPYDEH